MRGRLEEGWMINGQMSLTGRVIEIIDKDNLRVYEG